jgi:hypothetical protein
MEKPAIIQEGISDNTTNVTTATTSANHKKTGN